MANSASGESVISRVIRLLTHIGKSEGTLSMSQLAQAAQLPMPTVHRMVRELSDHGWVERQADGTMRLSLELWEITNKASSTTRLLRAARPFMEDVHGVVKQNTQLAVLHGDDVVFLECLARRGAVDNAVTVADRLPAQKSSAGFVLVAHLNEAEQEAFVERNAGTNAVNANRIRDQLATVRKNGYAVLEGIIHQNTTGISVPVVDRNGQIIAALSVVVPRDPQEIRFALPLLLMACRGINRALSEGHSHSMKGTQS